MKKLLNFVLLGTAAAIITGCTPSTIKNEETQFIPEGATISQETSESWTLPETSKYVIPENAETGEHGGPGAMETTAVDYSVYPEGKRPVAASPEEENKTLIIIYRQTDMGLQQDFDAVDECNADTLIESMTKNGAFKAGTKVTDFTVDGDNVGHITLDKLSIYSTRDEETVLRGIANTFIDNLGLSSLQITVGGEDKGTFEMSEIG